jgi:hypothetical protein
MSRIAKNAVWVIGITLLIACSVIVAVRYAPPKPLRDYISLLSPWMREADVTALIPARYFAYREQQSKFFSGTFVVSVGATPSYFICFSNDRDWPLQLAEHAYVYFDASGRLVGIEYSSSGHVFRPNWGEQAP